MAGRKWGGAGSLCGVARRLCVWLTQAVTGFLTRHMSVGCGEVAALNKP